MRLALVIVVPEPLVRDALMEALRPETPRGFGTWKAFAETLHPGEKTSTLAVVDETALPAETGTVPRDVECLGALIVLGQSPAFLPPETVRRALAKPFRLEALIRAVHNEADRLKDRESRTERPVGPWLFSPGAGRLRDALTGAEVILTDKESRLLTYLAEASANAPRSRDDLLHAVWHYTEGLDTHTLETHIYRLRRKLANPREGSDPFEVTRGGYALTPTWRGKPGGGS